MSVTSTIDDLYAPPIDLDLGTLQVRDPKRLAQTLATIHGYALEQAQRLRLLSPPELVGVCVTALKQLRTMDLISHSEVQTLTAIIDLSLTAPTLRQHVQAIETASAAHGADGTASAIGTMILEIALDSSRREFRQVQDHLPQQSPPPGAIMMAHRQIFAWLADVAGAAVGGVVGSPGNMVGALLVGGIVAAAASGAVLK